MKTKKLIKRTAAFCLTLAGFCAAQSAFAEVTVPEWQNSYTSAPTTTFYLYNTAKSKFATNDVFLVEDESKATTWTYSNKRLSTNGQNLNRQDSKPNDPEFEGAGADYTLEYNQAGWGFYWSQKILWVTSYFYVQANDELKLTFGSTNTKIYQWYFISVNQYNNHVALASAVNVLKEAYDYLNNAEDGEAKNALSNAINTAETNLGGLSDQVNADVDANDVSASITAATTTLEDALDAYKASIRGQFVTALENAITNAEKFTPTFEFLTSAIQTAKAAKDNNELSSDELCEAKSTLEGVVAQAQAIVNSDAYKTYSTYISMIETSNAKATEAGYAGYDATAATTAMNAEKQNLLGIYDAAGMTNINNTLKEHAEQVVRDYAYYAGAESVAGHAAKVGYTVDLAAIKAATVSEIPELIEGIRAEAKKGVFNYIANYEGEDPIDMTIFINNNSFEFGETGWNRGWNVSYTGGNPDIGARWNYLDYATIGCDGGYIYNTYKVYYDELAGYGVYQYITGLPNGKYKLEALLTSDPGNKIYLTVDAEKNKQTRVGEGVISENGKGEFVEVSCEFSVKDNAVTIGAIGEQKSSLYDAWFRADNFRLTLLPATMDEDGNEKPSDYTSGEVMPVVKVSREIKANQWTTLCLPMDCAKPASLSLYEVADETQDENGGVSVTVAASSDEKIKAGKPYIVKNADAVISEFVANGVSLVEAPTPAGEFIPFTGLFTTTELNAGDIYVSTSADNAEGDKPVYKSLSETAANKNMKGFRAYFQVPAETAESSVRFVTEGDLTGIMQAIEEQQTFAGAYNLSGHKVNTLQKGIYVIDGKKIIIK